jgi:hypothetical protein
VTCAGYSRPSIILSQTVIRFEDSNRSFILALGLSQMSSLPPFLPPSASTFSYAKRGVSHGRLGPPLSTVLVAAEQLSVQACAQIVLPIVLVLVFVHVHVLVAVPLPALLLTPRRRPRPSFPPHATGYASRPRTSRRVAEPARQLRRDVVSVTSVLCRLSRLPSSHSVPERTKSSSFVFPCFQVIRPLVPIQALRFHRFHRLELSLCRWSTLRCEVPSVDELTIRSPHTQALALRRDLGDARLRSTERQARRRTEGAKGMRQRSGHGMVGPRGPSLRLVQYTLTSTTHHSSSMHRPNVKRICRLRLYHYLCHYYCQRPQLALAPPRR